MAGFEDLIRGALEKQGNLTPERREAVYNSSRQALGRMIDQNPKIDEAAGLHQRQRLEQAILDVEKSYLPLAQPSQVEPSQVEPEAVMPDVSVSPAQPIRPVQPVQLNPVSPAVAHPEPQETRIEPQVYQAGIEPQVRQTDIEPQVRQSYDEPQVHQPYSDPQAQQAYSEPQLQESRIELQMGEDVYPSHYTGSVSRKRKPYAKLLLWTIILVGIGVAGWWAFNFGPALLKKQLDGSVPNPSRTIESGSFVPDGDNGWTSAFSATEDSSNIDSADRGTVQLFDDNQGQRYARLSSNPGSTRNTVRIKIPRGIMKTLQGQAPTFELRVKGDGGEAHQFAVFCEFSTMGDCGRQRFRTKQKPQSVIFDVLINDTTLPADEDAYLAINTDLSGKGRPVDVYSIRVKVGG